MHLIAEVLDKQLKDVRGVNAGRVDGIVLELREGKPPRVTYVEVSPITLFARFSERLARWYARIDAKIGHARGVPVRIPWPRLIHEDGPTLVFDFDLRATPIDAVEDWLRAHVLERISGGSGE